MSRIHRPERDVERRVEPIILPEQFRSIADEEVDDGTGTHDLNNQPIFSQKSMYGMLAAAQSTSPYPDEPQQSEDSESDEDDLPTRRNDVSNGPLTSTPHFGQQPMNFSRMLFQSRNERDSQSRRMAASMYIGSQGRARKKPKRRESFDQDTMTQSQILPPKPAMTTDDIRPPPSSLREATAAASVVDESSNDGDDDSDAHDEKHSIHSLDDNSDKLSHLIAEIFHLDMPEDILAEHPCWYLQNVLLQGYMYITARHICFYAYLQKRSNVAVKTGHIGKRGRRSYNFAYRPYYFVLKGDMFSYYQDASQPYFPKGQIDLRYATSANVTRENGEDTTDFTIEAAGRIYHYRAETSSDARVWVKELQKVIFRSHTDSDSVKILITADNVVSVERNPMVDFAETVKIRVLDKDETFAVDEYFFAFFNSAQDALSMLSQVTEASSAKKTSPTTKPQDSVERPINSLQPRNYHASKHTDEVLSGSEVHDSADSLTSTSLVQPSEDEHDYDEDDDDQEVDPSMSASQMLSHDAVFEKPTLRTPTFGAPATTTTAPIAMSSRPSIDRHGSTESGATITTGKPVDASASDRASRMLAGPLQHAINVAGMVRSGSKRVSTMLSSSPKVYIDKFSDAYAGGKKIYSDTADGLTPDDKIYDAEQDTHSEADEQRFRRHFGLPQSEKLVAAYYCWLMGNMPLYGKIYVGTTRFCYRSLLYGTKSKIVIPFRDMITVQQQRGFRWGYAGIVLVLRGHEELFFDFYKADARDHFKVFILRKLESTEIVAESTILTGEEKQGAEHAAAEDQALRSKRRHSADPPAVQEALDLRLDMAHFTSRDAASTSSKNAIPSPMNIICLTIGTRGDVQPYIALCKRLLAHGHKPTIATHAEFGDWVKSHNIGFVEVAGDPAELMRICVEHGMFTPSFFMEANSKFRSWLDGLLETAWDACQGADLLIESPSAMCGIHIAEALKIPYFRAFTMPWTRTRTYPHAFAVPTNKMGGSYNYMSYTFFDNIFWQAIAGQINRWRISTLHLEATNLDRMQQNRVPFLYNFSPNVVIPPLDFSDWIKVTGYWFLDEGKDYTPDPALADFIARARADKQKLVYIGFGSVTVNDSRLLTQQIVEAVLKADVRCILSKGWSDRVTSTTSTTISKLPDIPLPPSIHSIRAAPHDWLFAQLDAVVIHGGAGTTGAALRAGVPTVIKPFFGDQHFFATRVEDLGVGFHLPRLTAAALGKALWLATRDERVRVRAAALGKAIRAEDGVGNAINTIYAGMGYAKELIRLREVKDKERKAGGKSKAKKMSVAITGGPSAGSSAGSGGEEPAEIEETEENWTFVEVSEEGDGGASKARYEALQGGQSQQQRQQQQQQKWTQPLRLPAVLRNK